MNGRELTGLELYNIPCLKHELYRRQVTGGFFEALYLQWQMHPLSPGRSKTGHR